MRSLQQIHTAYKDKGLVMLGFNSADDKKIAVEFLKDNGATFPNVLDSSPEAQQFRFQLDTLGMSAVPQTYIIDQQGKIAGGWYGYEGNHAKGRRLLKQLGTK